MRFGGHQTFSIRDGWMFKGLQALIETPDAFGTDQLRDLLGVGKNMARSIQHWLKATGLARTEGKGRATEYSASELGELIWEYDRYFLYPGTWWIIHANLVSDPRNAYSWNWFFNRFTQTRFERAVVVEGLRRELQASGGRMPSVRTLERDIACLLRSYGQVLPREVTDPEDNLECPLVELGVMTHSKQTGFFKFDRGEKDIPFPVFGWVVSRRFASSDEKELLDVSLTELAYEENGPGRVFALSAEALFQTISRFERENPDRVQISSQAGERVIRFKNQPEEDWLTEYLGSIPPEEDVTSGAKVA